MADEDPNEAFQIMYQRDHGKDISDFEDDPNHIPFIAKPRMNAF